MKVKVSELRGKALDWAVAQVDSFCEGLTWRIVDGVMIGEGKEEGGRFTACVFLSRGTSVIRRLRLKGADIEPYSPSSLWSQAGPLIERVRVAIEWNVDHWEAATDATGGWLTGDTALEAAMRAVVMHGGKLVVEIPDELTGGEA